MSWESLRGVIEEHGVSERVDEYSDTFPRFQDAWDGLKWLLARTPDIKGSSRRKIGDQQFRVYVLAGDLIASTPEIWVVYTYDDEAVTILGVSAREAQVNAQASAE